MATILVTDDEPMLVELLQFLLSRAGFDVLPALDAPTALEHVEHGHPDLAILDINLGSWTGFELLERIRQKSMMPVIFLSGRDSEEDKVRGLRLGADDYVTKPFGYQELMARVQALLRRARRNALKEQANELHVGSLTLNRQEHSVRLADRAIGLTPTEFRMLDYLMRNTGRLIPIDEISKQLWGNGTSQSSKETARVAFYRLRRKLDLGDATIPVPLAMRRGSAVLRSI